MISVSGTLLAAGCENGEVVLSGYGTDDHALRGLTLNAKPSTHQVSSRIPRIERLLKLAKGDGYRC